MRKLISTLVLAAFIVNTLLPSSVSGQEIFLPAPGTMVHLSPSFSPPMLKGIKVYPDNPFLFDFILDNGDNKSAGSQEEASKLVKYFLASLTTPEKEMWVNLSPYEKDRIVPESFGQTEMGRDLLAQDYMLKQITASLIYPEDELGKKFWARISAEAKKKFGTTDIPINTFNKVWIVPEKAVVYENPQAASAYVVESSLKVMLEEDYVALSNQKDSAKSPVAGTGLAPAGDVAQNNKDTNALGSQIVREIVIPELTKEVNFGKNFSQLRQIYNSLILAAWYKKKIKDSILSQVYVDQNKVAGVNIDDPQEKQKIYEQYLEAFKKGAYNYIKEEVDPVSQKLIPKKYFSGGISALKVSSALEVTTNDRAVRASAPIEGDKIMRVQVASAPTNFYKLTEKEKTLLLDGTFNKDQFKRYRNVLGSLKTLADRRTDLLFGYGLKAVKARLIYNHNDEQIMNVGRDLLFIEAALGVDAKSFFDWILPGTVELYKDQFETRWPGIIRLVVGAKDNLSELFTVTLSDLENAYSDLDGSWPVLADIGERAGRNAIYIFENLIVLKEKKLIKSPEDLTRYAEKLFQLAEEAGTEAETVLRGLAVVIDQLAKTEDDVDGYGKKLAKFVKDKGPAAKAILDASLEEVVKGFGRDFIDHLNGGTPQKPSGPSGFAALVDLANRPRTGSGQSQPEETGDKAALVAVFGNKYLGYSNALDQLAANARNRNLLYTAIVTLAPYIENEEDLKSIGGQLVIIVNTSGMTGKYLIRILNAFKVLFPNDFKTYLPSLARLVKEKGTKSMAILELALPYFVENDSRHTVVNVIKNKKDLDKVIDDLITLSNKNSLYIFKRFFTEIFPEFFYAFGDHSKEYAPIFLELVKSPKMAYSSLNSFVPVMICFKDVIQNAEQFRGIGVKLLALTKKFTARNRNVSYFDNSFLTIVQIIPLRNMEQWESLYELINAETNLYQLEAAFQELHKRSNKTTFRDFSKIWQTLMPAWRRSEKTPSEFLKDFNRMFLISILIFGDRFESYWPVLNEQAINPNNQTAYLFTIGLKAVAHLINSPADLRRISARLVEFGNAAGKQSEDLYEGLVILKDVIRNEKDLDLYAQVLLDALKNTGNAKTFVIQLLPHVINIIKSPDDLRQQLAEIFQLIQMVPTVEGRTIAAIKKLQPLMDNGYITFSSFIKPVIYRQTVGAFLIFETIAYLNTAKAFAIKDKADADFLLAFINSQGVKAADILKNFIVKAYSDGTITVPISEEAETLQTYLNAGGYPIVAIYKAYKNNPDDYDVLIQKCRDIHRAIINGDTSAYINDPMLSDMLIYVFPPEITADRQMYENLNRNRPERQEDTAKIPEELRKTELFDVSTGQYVLKDPAKPMDQTPWSLLLNVIAKENAEKDHSMKDEEVVALGEVILKSWQENTLGSKQDALLVGLYKYHLSSGGRVMAEDLNSVQNILLLKEFAADTVRDLIASVLKVYQKNRPGQYSALLERMLKPKNYDGLATPALNIVQRFRDNKDEGINALGRMLKTDDLKLITSVWEKLVADKDLDAEKVARILNSIEIQIQPGKEAEIIARRLLGETTAQMAGEFSAKYEFNEGNDKIKLRFEVSKRKAHGVAGLNMGVCVTPSENLWNNPDFMNVIIWNEDDIAMGGMHILLITDGKKKYVSLPGINPNTSLLTKVNADDIYNQLIQYALQISRKLGYDGVIIPEQTAIHSNRGEIQRVITAKSYKKEKLLANHKFTSEPFAYNFQTVFIVDAPVAPKVKSGKPEAGSSPIKAGDTQTKGGIDFNADNLDLETRSSGLGGEIEFEMNPSQLMEMRNAPGFTPVIINIQPMINLQIFLGLSDKQESAPLAKML